MLNYTPHKKLTLRQHPHFNEAWLHDRICENPAILGLGDVRVLDRERSYSGAGRLDILLFDEENNRRFEVEVMLGPTDPSHIVRTIEYWDIERRRYPAYEHVAVVVAEEITTRFFNVMALFSGSIPIIAIQLDALQVGENILLNFVNVLDQTELRADDTEEDSGGGQVDRAYWEQKVGGNLMKVCDHVREMINATAKVPQELNFLRGYVGLRGHGVVRNFVSMSPKRTKQIVHVRFHNERAAEWKDRFDAAGVPAEARRKDRLRVTVTPDEFAEHRDLIREVVAETVKEQGA